jgi:hypothetical protein
MRGATQAQQGMTLQIILLCLDLTPNNINMFYHKCEHIYKKPLKINTSFHSQNIQHYLATNNKFSIYIYIYIMQVVNL